MPNTKKHFADRLVAAIKEKGSPICIGLDPRIAQIPEIIRGKYIAKKGRNFEAVAEAILEFNKGIIDAVHDLVPVVKPQIAFYEQYGFPGIWAFGETCKYAQEKGLIVIADVKRSDIGSSASAYSNAYLGEVDVFGEKIKSFDADAVTLAPYIGYDGIRPFVEDARKYGKGIFILVRTSNKTANELQSLNVCEKEIPLYEVMAHLVESWGADDIGKSGYSCIGAVVGATHPKEALALRKLMPHTYFLVPGYGAQGGSASDVSVCFNKDGLGAIINSSREIIFAYEKSGADEKDYSRAAREAVLTMRKNLEKAVA